MREHEDSTKSAAREARRPESIQQKSVHRKRDKEVSRHSAEVGESSQNLVHAWMATAQQCKRKTQPMLERAKRSEHGAKRHRAQESRTTPWQSPKDAKENAIFTTSVRVSTSQ